MINYNICIKASTLKAITALTGLIGHNSFDVSQTICATNSFSMLLCCTCCLHQGGSYM